MKKKKTLWLIVLIVSLLLCIVCSFIIIKHYFFDTVTTPGRTKATTPSVTQQTSPQTEAPTHKLLNKTDNLPQESSVNFKELSEINRDIYAWIYIENTNVDLPVAQSAPGESDSFYLNHNVYKNYQFSGTIYSEKHNKLDFSDPVTVLYGHNMLNGSMFATLHKFNDKSFFDKNTTMFVFTHDKVYTYLIYAAYQYDDRHILNSFNMDNPDSLKSYQDSTLLQRPYYCNIREGVSLDENDKILTLSTCMNSGGNVRYLVQGVLVNEQPAV